MSTGFLASKGIWGSLITLAPLIGEAFEKAGFLPPGTINELMLFITSTAGGILSLYGRMNQNIKPIKGVV